MRHFHFITRNVLKQIQFNQTHIHLSPSPGQVLKAPLEGLLSNEAVDLHNVVLEPAGHPPVPGRLLGRLWCSLLIIKGELLNGESFRVV